MDRWGKVVGLWGEVAGVMVGGLVSGDSRVVERERDVFGRE